MENTVKNLPAVADPQTYDVFRRSIGALAGQVAARHADLRGLIEQNRGELPPLFCTADSSEEPPQVPGVLWYVHSNNRMYSYSDGAGLWLSLDQAILSGNQASVTLGAGHYVLSRITLRLHSFITAVYVGVFTTAGLSARIDVVEVGGGIIGTNTFSLGAGSYAEVPVPVNKEYIPSMGIQVELTIFSGSLPATDVRLEARGTVV